MERDYVKETAQALADMNVFAALCAILEGGCIHSNSSRTAQRIIKISLAHQQRLLRDYDRARLKARDAQS